MIAYREIISRDEYVVGVQLLDGSFVENVEAIGNREPADIDLFSLVAPPQKYLADFSLWENHGAGYWNTEIVNRDLNKERFALDTYGIIMDASMPLYEMLMNVTYWYGLFSHQRETFQWKGFVVVDINAADDEIALQMMGEE